MGEGGARAGSPAWGGGGEEAPVLTLRLYIAGDAPNSSEARANLAAILERHVSDRYELEVVDFLREPQRALKDGVIVTPTLVKLAPPPVRKIIGTLRETPSVVTALGLGETHHA
jgi:circadian clock protein KaiB